MTTLVSTFLQDLERKEIFLTISESDKIQVSAKKGDMTPEILSSIKKHKTEIILYYRRNNGAVQQEPWQNYLKCAQELSAFPSDYSRGGALSNEYCKQRFVLPTKIVKNLTLLCQDSNVSIKTVLAAAFNLLLCRYSGMDDVVIGANVDPLNNAVVPLRGVIAPAQSFLQLMKQINEDIKLICQSDQQALQQMELKVAGSNQSFHPIYQNIIWFATIDNNQNSPWVKANITNYSPLDTILQVEVIDNAIIGCLFGNSDLFNKGTADRLVGNWITLLANIGHSGQMHTTHIDLLSANEKIAIANALDSCHDSNHQFQFHYLHQAFEFNAYVKPNEIAISSLEGDSLSYAQLNDKANILARHLINQGVKPGDHIGLFLLRNIDLVASLIAILKTGAAYIPLDPKYPIQRFNDIVEDAQLQRVLCCQDTVNALSHYPGVKINIDNIATDANNAELPVLKDANQLSHIIYTSGSTGKPKGVMISHSNVIALLEWTMTTYSLNELKRVLLSTSICFDLSVFEIWAPLIAGGEIVIVDNALDICGKTSNSLTLINTVPSVLKVLLEEKAIPQNIKTINVAGEPLSMELVNAAFAGTDVDKVYNLYGPTEDTTYSTAVCMTKPLTEPPTIGTPIAQTFAKVLDQRGMPVPIGAVGELYLGGFGVTQGYLNNKGLTKQKFAAFENGAKERLYSSGDLVKLLDNGCLAYIGRKDNQVKIRGFRIELEEIEHVIASQSTITDVAVIVKTLNGQDCLVAFCVPTSDKEFENQPFVSELRQRVMELLPDFMIPTAFVLLEKLPFTKNGKCDRLALANQDIKELNQVPAFNESSSKPTIHDNKTVTTIIDIWSQLLKTDVIDPGHDFFNLGGNSLLGMKMVSKINRAFDIEFPLRDIFEYRTVASLAQRIDEFESKEGVLPLEPVDSSHGVPATSAQQGMWMVANVSGVETIFNMVIPFELIGELNIEALKHSLVTVIDNHVSLRAYFSKGKGSNLTVNVEDKVELPWTDIDITQLEQNCRQSKLKQIIAAERSRKFKLSAAPLMRAVLVRIEPANYLFVLTFHHLIADAWSINLFKDEISTLYNAKIVGKSPEKKHREIRFTDFAYWQNKWQDDLRFKRQVAYWQDKIALVIDNEPFRVDSKSGIPIFGESKINYLDLGIDMELTRFLQQYSKQHGLTVYTLLMAVIHLALYRYSGIAKQIVSSPITGRYRAELESSFGLYTSMISIISDIQSADTLMDFIEQIKNTIYEAHDNAAASSVMTVNQKSKSGTVGPQVNIQFNYLDLPEDNRWQLSNITVNPYSVSEDVSFNSWMIGLNFFVGLNQNSVESYVGYNNYLFEKESALEIHSYVHKILDALRNNLDIQIEKIFD